MIKSIFLQKKVSWGILMVAGLFVFLNGIHVVYAADGDYDPTFDAGWAVGTVDDLHIQSSGKIIIIGGFGIQRLNTDGTVDASFNVAGSGPNNDVQAIVAQSDGKMIIGGEFTEYNLTAVNHIARINIDGSLDATFSPAFSTTDEVLSLALQSDGKILLGTGHSGSGDFGRIRRLNVDGSVDVTFNSGVLIAWEEIDAIALQSDGKIIIGGYFTGYDGTARSNIARLNIDGTLDASFDPGTGPDSVIRAVVVQSDDRILIAGSFNYFNGTARSHFARLNTNGTLDVSLDPGTGPGTLESVQAIKLQSNGKIIIGGEFSVFNSVAISRIARLHPDGSVDTTFDPGDGVSSAFVYAIALQSDGKMVIGGDFYEYDGENAYNIVRVDMPDSIAVLLQDIIIPNPTPTQIETRITEGYMAVTEGSLNAATTVETNVNVTYRAIGADAIFPTGTNTTKQGGGTVDFANFTIANVTEAVRGSYPDSRVAFRLGIPGENLSFSQDITVVTKIGNPYNGQELDILYQNEGSTEWSPHSTPTCTVIDGECTFTTDHATIYTVNGEHSVTGAAPIDINVEVQDTLSLDCYDQAGASDDHTVSLGTAANPGLVTAGTPAVGRSTCEVTTNDDQGYYLTIINSNPATEVLTHIDPNTAAVYEIDDLTNYVYGSSTENWTAPTTKGLGFSVVDFPDIDMTNNDFDSIWNETDACPEGLTADTNDYAGIPNTAQPIAAVTQYEASTTVTDICYKVDVPSSQPSGQYSGEITYTATTDASSYHN